jgi:hypothetical protein
LIDVSGIPQALVAFYRRQYLYGSLMNRRDATKLDRVSDVRAWFYFFANKFSMEALLFEIKALSLQ